MRDVPIGINPLTPVLGAVRLAAVCAEHIRMGGLGCCQDPQDDQQPVQHGRYDPDFHACCT